MLPGTPWRRSPDSRALGSATSEPGLGHLEKPDLAGRSVAVLGGGGQAQAVVPVTVEGKDRVDEVFEGTRTGEPAVFVTCPTSTWRRLEVFA